MNFEFIEGRKTGDKVVEFEGGMGIADEEIVNRQSPGGQMGWVCWRKSIYFKDLICSGIHITVNTT
jgi:hypothetical protein